MSDAQLHTLNPKPKTLAALNPPTVSIAVPFLDQPSLYLGSYKVTPPLPPKGTAMETAGKALQALSSLQHSGVVLRLLLHRQKQPKEYPAPEIIEQC